MKAIVRVKLTELIIKIPKKSGVFALYADDFIKKTDNLTQSEIARNIFLHTTVHFLNTGFTPQWNWRSPLR